MPVQDNRIDSYIARSGEFAQPILKHLRKLVHQGCPSIEETLKWGFPNFMYRGSILCSMAAFKAHCSFGFWKGDLLFASKKRLKLKPGEGMGQFGRITAISDLPEPDVLLEFIREAVRLKDEGIKPPPRSRLAIKRELEVPDDITAALKKNQRALAAFEAFSYSHRKEYVEWIVEAKKDETRQRRLMTAIDWMANGKSRNWKYERC
jgi:uncharacterized protein YdeI (YjbR/CyaY-like superfamily)